MPGSSPAHRVISCPHCHSANEMTVDGIGRHEMIACSRCGAPMGLWKDLKPSEPEGQVRAT